MKLPYRAQRMMNRTGRNLRLLFNWPEKQLYRTGIFSTRNLTLPDFLIIGAPKAGTWWLASNLEKHPEVYLARGEKQGELHYFDKWFYQSVGSYSKFFIQGQGRIKGEKTPAYSVLSVERIRFIRTILPRVRLIYTLRNPIERTWSHALMDLVRSRKARVEDVSIDAFIDHFRTNQAKGNYLANLDRWLNVFPREQMLVCFFDDIKNAPREMLVEVFKHIGVSSEVEWSKFPFDKVDNKGPGAVMPADIRLFLEEMHRKDLTALRERFGERVRAW